MIIFLFDVCQQLSWDDTCPWWRHQMETFSALLALCEGNSPVTSELHAQRPVTRSFDVFFDQRPNKRLSKQSWGWWFEEPSCALWRHSNANSNMKFNGWEVFGHSENEKIGDRRKLASYAHPRMTAFGGLTISRCYGFRRSIPRGGTLSFYDDVMKWKRFPHYWPLARDFHRSNWQ